MIPARLSRLSALWLLLALIAPAAARAAPDLYRIDTVHSQVLFAVSHDNFSNPVGRFHIHAGWLRFDPQHWSKGGCDVLIDTGSVDLGDKDWDAAVRAARFLDSRTWPLAHFHCDRLQRTGKRSGLLHGTLTLRGVQQPVTLAVRFNRRAFTIFGAHTVAGFSARATLDRTHFGMTAFTGSVSRQVDIHLEIEGILDADARHAYRKENADADSQ